MTRFILLIIVSAYITGCAPSIRRMGYTVSSEISESSDCNVTILRNADNLNENDKIGTISVYDNGMSTNCSEQEMISLIKKDACKIGASTINLYNIREPSIFGSTCFQAYADFYKTAMVADSASLSEKTKESKDSYPVMPIKTDSIKNEGSELRIGMDIGSVMSGGQLDLAKSGLSPTPDGLSRTSFNVRYSYWAKIAGIDFEYDYSVASASKASYKPLSLYDQNLFRLGAAYAPMMKITLSGLHRLSLRGGLNYDLLKFDSDAKIPIYGQAKGFGYYLLTQYDYVSTSRFLGGVSIGYENKNPKMDGATKALSSNEIVFSFGFGYKFKSSGQNK